MERKEIERDIRRALREDKAHHDRTSRAIRRTQQATALISAQQQGVLAGLEIAIEVFRAVDDRFTIIPLAFDGDEVEDGTPILMVKGNARKLMAAERVALNYLMRLSGIAKLTSRFVKPTLGTNVKILDTRKTIPGLRIFDKYAVRVGGGKNHRMDLDEMVMLKDTHLELVRQDMDKDGGVITEAVRRERVGDPDVFIAVEVQNEQQAQEALDNRVDRIMLDNMSLRQMGKVVRFIRSSVYYQKHAKPTIEATGGINLKALEGVISTGVDYVSVGAITHSASSLSFHQKIISPEQEQTILSARKGFSLTLTMALIITFGAALLAVSLSREIAVASVEIAGFAALLVIVIQLRQWVVSVISAIPENANFDPQQETARFLHLSKRLVITPVVAGLFVGALILGFSPYPFAERILAAIKASTLTAGALFIGAVTFISFIGWLYRKLGELERRKMKAQAYDIAGDRRQQGISLIATMVLTLVVGFIAASIVFINSGNIEALWIKDIFKSITGLINHPALASPVVWMFVVSIATLYFLAINIPYSAFLNTNPKINVALNRSSGARRVTSSVAGGAFRPAASSLGSSSRILPGLAAYVVASSDGNMEVIGQKVDLSKARFAKTTEAHIDLTGLTWGHFKTYALKAKVYYFYNNELRTEEGRVLSGALLDIGDNDYVIAVEASAERLRHEFCELLMTEVDWLDNAKAEDKSVLAHMLASRMEDFCRISKVLDDVEVPVKTQLAEVAATASVRSQVICHSMLHGEGRFELYILPGLQEAKKKADAAGKKLVMVADSSKVSISREKLSASFKELADDEIIDIARHDPNLMVVLRADFEEGMKQIRDLSALVNNRDSSFDRKRYSFGSDAQDKTIAWCIKNKVPIIPEDAPPFEEWLDAIWGLKRVSSAPHNLCLAGENILHRLSDYFQEMERVIRIWADYHYGRRNRNFVEIVRREAHPEKIIFLEIGASHFRGVWRGLERMPDLEITQTESSRAAQDLPTYSHTRLAVRIALGEAVSQDERQLCYLQAIVKALLYDIFGKEVTSREQRIVVNQIASRWSKAEIGELLQAISNSVFDSSCSEEDPLGKKVNSVLADWLIVNGKPLEKKLLLPKGHKAVNRQTKAKAGDQAGQADRLAKINSAAKTDLVRALTGVVKQGQVATTASKIIKQRPYPSTQKALKSIGMDKAQFTRFVDKLVSLTVVSIALVCIFASIAEAAEQGVSGSVPVGWLWMIPVVFGIAWLLAAVVIAALGARYSKKDQPRVEIERPLKGVVHLISLSDNVPATSNALRFMARGSIISGIGMIVIAALIIVLYKLILWISLIGFFRGDEFNYGWFRCFIASSSITGIVIAFAYKCSTFFRKSLKDSKDKKIERIKRKRLFKRIYYGAFILGLPYVLIANFGSFPYYVSQGFDAFSSYWFKHLIILMLIHSFIIQVILKIIRYDDEISFRERLKRAVVATFVAPVSEEVLFRALFLNASLALWVGVFGFTEPFNFTLPILGINIGFGLPLGVFIAIIGNADGFFRAHGRGKWFHHWLMGAVASYAYLATGSLLVPIIIHFLWNGIVSIFTLVTEVVMPLNGYILKPRGNAAITMGNSIAGDSRDSSQRELHMG
ncbi:carboxylating nicotinate-nucleotide diphosphorylase, partial [Candidatus Omnitrophota bacterium]